MSEVRDPAIKLFGKTIPLLPKRQFSVLTTAKRTHFVAAADDDDHEQKQQNSSISSSEAGKSCVRVGDAQEDGKKPAQSEVTETIREDDSSHRAFEELKDLQTSCDNPKTPSLDEEPNSPKPSKNEEQSETSNSQEKTLKKPDKIAPCPRCNSMDTKFCYYNNYNINQPRHFCKNCQRYWTAGGTMRNVPVGSGRRKNKSSPASSHYQHVLVSECLQAARANAGNGLHHPVLGTDGSTVLSFGSDSQPVCESIASALDLEENPQNRVKTSVSCGKGENGDDQTSKTSDLVDKGGKGNSVFQEPVVMNFPWPPWPFPWNSPQWRAAIPPPTLGPTGLPIAFYPPPPPPYWGCAAPPAAPPGSWNVPWLSPPLASPDPPAVCPSPNMPTLGKHSRNVADKEDHSKGNNSEGGVWIPKTLRIDDPNEAAKSSIWSTLGIIKNEKNESINAGGGLFKAFQSKGDEKQHIADTSLALQTNPAALSRSFNFHESV